MNARDQRHLQFIYDRLITVHSENPNYDYMHRLKEIIGDIPEPHTAPSNHPCIVKITKAQYEAMRQLIIQDAGNKEPFTATKSLALDGLMQMSYCFGASSTDYITLYPTIG